ncbi:MAG: ABC transporter substrate-binding protein [Actinomycetia bacterium]|nr:ABC transporter substrate-binding protein [Actinomycetes bacterium]
MKRPMPHLLAILLSTAMLSGACTPSGDEAPAPTSAVDTTIATFEPSSTSITIATTEPESFDAHHVISTRAIDLAGLLHQGLTVVGTDGRAAPGLAESWTSDDLITWTFVLKPGSTFSDGTPITATTFASSWQALASQSTRARSAYLGIEASIANWAEVLAGNDERQIGVRALDELTFEVQLAHANSWLPEYVAHPAFAPVPESMLSTTAEDGTSNAVLVSSGPYEVEGGVRPGDGVDLVKRTAARSGEVGRVLLRFFESDQAASQAVVAGSADLALADEAVPPEGVEVTRHDSNGVWYLGFPTPRGPASSPEPRQVLSSAIDRSAFESDLAIDTIVHSRSFAPRSSIHGSTVVCTWCRFNPERATALAEENEIEPPEEPFSIHVVEGSPVEPWAHSIAADWRDVLGWPVEVATHPSVQGLIGYLQSGVPSGPFLVPWYADHRGADAFIEPLLDPAGSDDFVRYNNSSLVSLFASVSSTSVDDTQRLLTMNELGLELNEVLPYVPLGIIQRTVVHDGRFDLEAISGGAARIDLTAIRTKP